MPLCKFELPGGAPHVGFVYEEQVWDMTAVDPVRAENLSDLLDFYRPLEIVRELLEIMEPIGTLEALLNPGDESAPRLLAPVDKQEIWAAGVTYLRSRDARMAESEAEGDCYDRVYDAARPELFLKALPHRVRGPGQSIRVRADSQWTVPEPELAAVVNGAGELRAFTVGNDVSSRDIEGANPLYLPQAKVYEGSCALGPVVMLVEEIEDADNLGIHLRIERQQKVVFEGSTSTAQMRRKCDELIQWLTRELKFPEGVILLTGTGVVPADDVTLLSGDVVSITIDQIGTLTNPVA